MTAHNDERHPIGVPFISKQEDRHYVVLIKESRGQFYVASNRFLSKFGATRGLKKIREEMYEAFLKSRGQE